MASPTLTRSVALPRHRGTACDSQALVGHGVTPLDVRAAHARLAGYVRHTPMVPSPLLSRRCGSRVELKLETLQDIGAFKIRGAFNRLLTLSAEERKRGVITVSTGNHALAVAAAAEQLGIRAVVCMSTLVAQNKFDAVRARGAEVHLIGRCQDEAAAAAVRLAETRGFTLISPFDDPAVIAGQGTIGLELLEDAPDLDAVLVPVSGGGLISGVALALKAARPHIRVIGVSMENGAAMYTSLLCGQPVRVEEVGSLADSLGGGIGLDNRHTFAMTRDLVDDMIVLSEDEIAAGMRFLFRHERQVVEGAAAVGVGAILAGKAGWLGRRCAVLLTGRNVDMDLFTRLVTGT